VVFLVAIFIALLFSIKAQKVTDELNGIIKGMEKEGAEMEGFIKVEYKINSIEDAIAELEKLGAGMVKFLYDITKSIK
jgi:hypothetical protein